MEKPELDRIKQSILDAVDFCRSMVLDTFEVECGDSANWEKTRGRLLRSFGDRGLVGHVVKILDGAAPEGEK